MSSTGPDPQGVDFNTVYSAFYPRILRYLTRLVGPDEAEDVSQEVFIKLSRSLSDYRGEGISSWVYRIATNAAMDRRRRASAIVIPAEEESIAADPAETAEQHLIRGQMSECVRRFIDQLPETYRAVLILSEVEGLADAEIAGVVGATLETVKIRLHRARHRLARRSASTAVCITTVTTGCFAIGSNGGALRPAPSVHSQTSAHRRSTGRAGVVPFLGLHDRGWRACPLNRFEPVPLPIDLRGISEQIRR